MRLRVLLIALAAASLSLVPLAAAGRAAALASAQQVTPEAARRDKVCPKLPPAPKGLRRFKLVAAKFPNSKTQTLAYNGTAVGPLIRVRVGEPLEIAVTNADIEEGTSTHWHGQDLPGAAWADGVDGVSQTPIPVGQTFAYRFTAEPAGTFWYHSHTGEQFGDGLRGPLIVDDPSDPHRALYDFDLDEHVLMLADVFASTVAEQLKGLQMGGMAGMAGGGGGNSMGGMGRRRLRQETGGGMAGMAGMSGMGGGQKPANSVSMAGMSGGQQPASSGSMGGMSGMGGGQKPASSGSMGGMGGMSGMGGAQQSASGGSMGGMAGMGGAAAPAPAPAAGHSGASMGGAAAASAAPPTSCPPDVLDQDISDAPWGGVQVNGRGGAAPLVITVKPGKRYRLRVIGGQSSWALRVAPGGGHTLRVIALDGRPVAPRTAAAVVISSGERVDAVLAADRPVGNYWLDVSTLTGINSPAIIHYEGAPEPMKDAAFLATKKAEFGCAPGVGGQPGVLDLKNATFASGVPVSVPQTASKTFVFYLADAATTKPPPQVLSALLSPAVAGQAKGFRPSSTNCPPMPDGSKSKYCWSMNWNLFAAPAKPLMFPKSSPGDSTYTLQVTQGHVVDIVLINPSRMVHPQHLHGSGFFVLAAGNGNPLGSDGLSVAKGFKLNLADPPVKDTIAVPQSIGEGPEGYGYSIVRFKADNPGAWPFHCHIDLHAASGMFSVFAVNPPKAGKAWFAPKGATCGAAL